jgi:hypothetical protein
VLALGSNLLRRSRLPESNPTDMLKYASRLRPAAQAVMQMSAKMPSLNTATPASIRKSGPPPIKLPIGRT